MSVAFIDLPGVHVALLPLSYTKPSCKLRVGILTIEEKWMKYLGEVSGYYTEDYLSKKFSNPSLSTDYLVASNLIPEAALVNELEALSTGEALEKEGRFLAGKFNGKTDPESYSKKEFEGKVTFIDRTWEIFLHNGQEIRKDYQLITANRHSFGLSDKHSRCYGKDIFLEEGASVKAAILNAEEGPIYIGKNAQVHEGAIIKGPFAMCEGAHVNMGAKLRGDTTVGPYSKVGGEVSNAVIQGYSNKGHDGFLGNAVIGEWCNLGADTNNSNLKNNYANVKMWNYETGRFLDTGLQFCGLIMGDHSKCGINTMFNTGTTIGVAANIFGSGFPRNVIPSFSWGGANGFVTHKPIKAFETARLVMQRRNVDLTEEDEDIMNHIFDNTSGERIWEKK